MNSVIQSIELLPVSFPLKSPFVTAAGRKSETHNVQIRLTLANGLRGLAEASSSIAMPGESQKNLISALESLRPELINRPIDACKELMDLCWKRQPFHPTAAAAMECALLDTWARSIGKPLWRLFGSRARDIETDLTLSVDHPDAVARAAKAAWAQGFRRLKVKLSGDERLDWVRLKAVQAVAPKARVVADGNQGFTLTRALDLANRMARTGLRIEFLEQPFLRHDWKSMRQFRRRCAVPLYADESVRTPMEALRLFESEAADGVNVKIAKSGLMASVDILHIARRFKKGLSIGCMEESKLGLAASVHLACGSGAFDWVDLDSAFLLKARAIRGGFRSVGPLLSVKGIGPGIGIA